MSMPPSGVEGKMDEEAVIEAEIQFELDNIDLDNDNFQNDDDIDADLAENDEVELQNADILDVPNELDTYIKSIQEQTNRFEQELLECDSILNHSKITDGQSQALIPYEDQSLLQQLAKERGCTVEEYQRQILEEIENDEVTIEDELAGLIDEEDSQCADEQNKSVNGDLKAITENGEENLGGIDGRMEVEVQKALEEGLDPDEVPVSKDLLPVNGQVNSTMSADIQKMLRGQLERLEVRFQERINKIKKDEAYKRDEEDVRQHRIQEERQWKRQEIEREEQKLALQQQAAQRDFEKAEEEIMRQMQQSRMKFEEEMAELQAETETQKREYETALDEERRRQADRREKATVKIQSRFRGYRVRKDVAPTLNERRGMRRKQKEEERIKEVEVEIEKRKEEQAILEQKKREKEEEDKMLEEERKRQKEDEKRQKELEKKQKEEEKRRLKEEEERKKQEEKKRKEEEKQRKKEEEKKRKEEEKKRKEEEEQRKKEEKRLKEEEEKRKKEEIKKQKEEEKKRKEDEERKKKEEEEGWKHEKIMTEGEKQRQKENKEKEGERATKQDSDIVQECVDVKTEKDGTISNFPNNNEQEISIAVKEDKADGQSTEVENKQSKNISPETLQTSTAESCDRGAKQVDALTSKVVDESKRSEQSAPEREKPRTPRTKTPRSARKPKPATPRKSSQDIPSSSGSSDVKEPEKPDMTDCLPEHLEERRLQFIKQCLPWSKVANEPWKLKTGVSKRPLRRPSSAKKLPLLSENIIIEAGKVASLKQVTTVQLSDLPGNNISTLGQCWGLKYLSLTNCNLVAVDGLGQCKQLQYLDVKNNKIEFLDLKDIGQLQYVNVSHNRLSSVHGLDKCTNLRWLDLSHNNITRLGGMETLRRLSTLKLSHNQLISTGGLGDTLTLQMIDMSHNHLQAVEDMDKLCLLVSLDLSSNNLLEIPKLTNQVLLQELLLGDNSISSLAELETTWLPLLNKLVLCQNSIDELPVLETCLLLKELDLSNNQLLDPDSIHRSVEKCVYLESLNLEENPVTEELNKVFYEKLGLVCPRLQCHQSSSHKSVPIKPRTSFETMCLTQCHGVRDIMMHFDNNLKSLCSKGHPVDLVQFCDIHYKFCEKLFSTLIEYRYAHEYGEVTVTVPMAPKTPRSTRPQSARQKDKFMNPKDLFENALKSSGQTAVPEKNNSGAKSCVENAVSMADSNSHDGISTLRDKSSDPKDLFANALESAARDDIMANSNIHEGGNKLMDASSDPKDLFEQALKSARTGATKQSANSGFESQPKHATNGDDRKVAAATTIQAFCRGWLTRHEITEQTKIWLAATAIQAIWRGHRVRRITRPEIERRRRIPQVDSKTLQKLHVSATKIQALWRGYILRKKLLAALEYAQYDWSDEEDQEAMDLNDEFDVDKFLDFDGDQLDSDWKPPETPDIPISHPVLRKPPSGKPKIPPINTGDNRPPSNPRRAWKNLESPMSDYGKVPHPPSSLASATLTARSGMSKKEEKISEEWGFKDSSTAHLMMQRAKKMKYNAERRKKINKLDPKQRLALFRKLEEVTGHPTYQVPQQKILPRKEYFQARQEEVNRQEQEKRQEFHTRVSRTFEWLHTQVGDHPVSDSIINQNGARYAVNSNLPELQGGRVQLVSSPILEIQSVDSASTSGQRSRRFSAGSGGPAGKLPPILQTTSAPTQHTKERMSFRNPKKNQDVGWGSGKKRTNKF